MDRNDTSSLQSFLAQRVTSAHRGEAQALLQQLQQQKLEAQQRLERQKAEQQRLEQPKPEQPKLERTTPELPSSGSGAAVPERAAENSGIRAALEQFNAAFQAKQPRDLKKVWPTVPDATEKAMRLPGTSYLMVLRPLRDPQVVNNTASVLCELTTTVTLRGQSTDKQRQVLVLLEKTGASWTITNPFSTVR